jgi:hypothetical protein
MSHLVAIRSAIFDLVNGISLTPVQAGLTWQFAEQHPVKQPIGYPGFCVIPVRNATQTLDSITEQAEYTFSILILTSFEDATDAEDTIVGIGDLVYDTMLNTIKSGQLELHLGDDVQYSFDGDVSGEWGFDADHGERFYRIDVTARVEKSVSLY